MSEIEGVEEDANRDTVESILSFDCELEAGDSVQLMLEQLASRPDWPLILSDLAFDLTHRVLVVTGRTTLRR